MMTDGAPTKKAQTALPEHCLFREKFCNAVEYEQVDWKTVQQIDWSNFIVLIGY